MKWESILETFLKFVLGLGFVKKGFKTIVFNIVVFIAGLLEVVTKEGGILEWICNSLNWGCDLTGAGWFITAFAVINIILRAVTTTPIAEDV